MLQETLGPILEQAYKTYNHRRFVHPDPLEFLYRYDQPADREVAGMVASSLAYGRVAQVLKSTDRVLEIFGKHPAQRLPFLSRSELGVLLHAFKHRFTTGEEMAGLLFAMGKVLETDGTLRALLKGVDRRPWVDVIDDYAARLNALAGGLSTLLPLPSRGSACKRLMMFMRWMVRRDEVDVGDWHDLGTQRLIVPLDTHMFRVARELGLTRRRSTSLRAALEVTEAFRKIRPDDPVRYDFALTRPGIRHEKIIGLKNQDPGWDTAPE